MNRKYTTQISALLMSAAVTIASCPPSAYVRAAEKEIKGKSGDYNYELYNENFTGDLDFTPEDDGRLVLKTNSVHYLQLIKGLEFNEEHKCSDYKKITLNYDMDYSFSEGSIAHFGAYGWTKNKQAEFIVTDGWYGWRQGGTIDPLETVEIDGALYDIYVMSQFSMGGIMGTGDGWYQYFSVRRENKTEETSGSISGTITLSEHFKVWEKYGFSLDSNLYSASVSADAYECPEFNVTINKGEVFTEYAEDKPADTKPEEPTSPAVTDPEPEITVSEPEITLPTPEDTLTPEISDAPEITPAVTEPVTTEEKPAITEPVVSEVPAADITEPVVTDPDKPGPRYAEPEITPGDADGNGAITIADLAIMKKKLLDPDDSISDIYHCDLNKDSKFNVVDFIMLKSIISSVG